MFVLAASRLTNPANLKNALNIQQLELFLCWSRLVQRTNVGSHQHIWTISAIPTPRGTARVEAAAVRQVRNPAKLVSFLLEQLLPGALTFARERPPVIQISVKHNKLQITKTQFPSSVTVRLARPAAGENSLPPTKKAGHFWEKLRAASVELGRTQHCVSVLIVAHQPARYICQVGVRDLPDRRRFLEGGSLVFFCFCRASTTATKKQFFFLFLCL